MEFMGKYSRAHICQCLSHLSTQRGDSIVTIFGDRKKTGEKFVQDVLSLARGLVDLGIRQGDVVAISAFTSDMYLEWLLAVAFVGGISAPLNYRWSFEEAGRAMMVARPVILVADDSCQSWYSNLQDAHLSSVKWFVSLGSHPSNFRKRLKVLTPEMLKKYSMKPLLFNYSWALEGAAIICFSSGTTGEPKGVTISHGALIIQSLAKLLVVGYREDDVYLHTAPLCHIGGLSSAMAMLMVGGCHVLIPKFEPKAVLEAIEQHCVTSLIAVPAMMADLIGLVRKKEIWKGRKTVNKILNGGGALSTELIKETTIFFPKAKLLSAYGMTETCSSLTFIILHDPTKKTSYMTMVPRAKSDSVRQQQGICVGKPAPNVELKICGDEFTHVGRILTRGPHVMLRYWGQVQTKPSDCSDDDWFDTGDIGSIDKHGNLWLIGRKNGRIKSGGENIYPEEVEAILKQHPGVASVVVVGVPETRLTEMVVACIQLEENWQWSQDLQHSVSHAEFQLSRDTLRNYCKQNDLSGFKIPKDFIVRDKPFPLTSSGKNRRDQIRAEVIMQLQYLNSNL